MPNRTLPSFTLLWSSYPTENHPCDQGWSNQCAIRMSITLIAAGFPLTNYTEPVCKHRHARGAESLATYLWRQVGRPQIATTSAAAWTMVNGKKGLIFFKDIAGFRDGIGDHFDCWNAGITKTGEYIDHSKQVWFWEAT